MNEFRKLMETLDRIVEMDDDGILYVYDGGEIYELDTNDELAMQRFHNQYGLHEINLSDFPVERGVQTIDVGGQPILISADPQALAAEVESY